MKIYLKILMSTIAIQVVVTALCFALFFLPESGRRAIPVLIAVGYMISLVTDIYMAVRSDSIWYKKLMYIFLMPTNYTPVGLLWAAMYLFGKFFEMLPGNLG